MIIHKTVLRVGQVGKKRVYSRAAVTMSEGPWFGSIDQGTNSTRFFVFNSMGEIVASSQQRINLSSPRPGWVEQDPVEILDSVKFCIESVCSKIKTSHSIDARERIKAIGITNQRETTIAWDSDSGNPFYPALVWMDTRNHIQVEQMLKTPNVELTHRQMCGLPISTYFSAGKMHWLLNNVKRVKQAQEDGKLRFGTVDTWLLWNLVEGRPHLTDVTNAHRTALLGLKELAWRKDLAMLYEIDGVEASLAKVKPSSGSFGILSSTELAGVPVMAVLGDQHAALLGQGCVNRGQVKNTFGTGCFLLCNIGTDPIITQDGLITTIAYQLGANESPVYALEASMASAGSAIEWLYKKLGIIPLPNEIDRAASMESGGVVFVPALSGLLAPRWNAECGGAFLGLRLNSGKEHLIRAVINAIAFQNRQVLDLMQTHLGSTVNELVVDGGLTNSEALMQTQADVLKMPVVRPRNREASIFGAAKAAAIGAGHFDWPLGYTSREPSDIFYPRPKTCPLDGEYEYWKSSVELVCRLGTLE